MPKRSWRLRAFDFAGAGDGSRRDFLFPCRAVRFRAAPLTKKKTRYAGVANSVSLDGTSYKDSTL